MYVYSRGDFIYFPRECVMAISLLTILQINTVKPSLLPLPSPCITITLLIYYVSSRCRLDVLYCKFVNTTI